MQWHLVKFSNFFTLIKKKFVKLGKSQTSQIDKMYSIIFFPIGI